MTTSRDTMAEHPGAEQQCLDLERSGDPGPREPGPGAAASPEPASPVQEPAPGHAVQSLKSVRRTGGQAIRNPGAPNSRGAETDRERHLRAAWRLSRSMWRYRERSAEETRAGLAICHHLRALLEESEPRR